MKKHSRRGLSALAALFVAAGSFAPAAPAIAPLCADAGQQLGQARVFLGTS